MSRAVRPCASPWGSGTRPAGGRYPSRHHLDVVRRRTVGAVRRRLRRRDGHGVTTFGDGFVASGYDDELHRAVLWTSPNGRVWNRMGDQPDFHRAQMDGITNFGATVVAFGRDLDTNAIVIWTSDGTSRWQRTTVDDNAASGSRIRAITTDGNMTAAAGVDTAHDGTAVWTSQDMRSWRKTIVTDRTS